MALSYEKIVKEDLYQGYGSVSVPMPAGGSATGQKIGLHTFNEVYNVKDFGAVGDQITDDTQAIRDAIAALPKTGSDQAATLYFPRGIYRLNPTTFEDTDCVFLLDRNATDGDREITIQGAGHGASMILYDSASTGKAIFKIKNGTSDFVRRLNFRDVMIHGQDKAAIGVLAIGWAYSYMKNCELRSCTSVQLEVRNLNGYLSDAATFDSFALDISNNLIIHSGDGGALEGTGIYLNGYSLWTRIHHNTFGEDLRGFGLLMNSCRQVTVDHNSFISFTDSDSRSGIMVQGSAGRDNQIIGNTFAGLQEHGIEIAGTQDGLLIQGNQIDDISRSSPGTFHGISQIGSCANLKILDNNIRETTALDKAINCNSSGVGIVRGNYVSAPGKIVATGAYIAQNGQPAWYRGRATITGAATTVVVTPGATEPDTSYRVLLGVAISAGAPAAGSTRAYISAKTTTTFTITVEVAPGGVTAVDIDWEIFR